LERFNGASSTANQAQAGGMNVSQELDFHRQSLPCQVAKEFGIKMKNILPAKDGKFVSQFDSWRIPRNNGGRSDDN